MLLFISVAFLLSFFVTLVATPVIIKATLDAGMIGRDLHKPSKPIVSELGGLAMAAGIIVALLFAISANSFATLKGIFQTNVNVVYMLAALCTVLLIELIGFTDDVLGVRHKIKFLLPLAAALPLMAVKIASLHPLSIPFIGPIGFITPLIYVAILIPLGLTAATNLTNVFAGFNGIEAGMGAVMAAALALIGWHTGSIEVTLLGVAMLGVTLAFLRYNWYPSKIFPDDVGTLLMGVMVGTTAIVGGIEMAGVILLLPYIIDFIFYKIPNRLPSTGWGGVLREGKLYCDGKPVHLAQAVMKATGGIKEKDLVLIFIAIEAVLALVGVGLYW